MFPILYIFSDWTILFLRLVLGVILLAHGWPKIKDLKTAADNFLAMGFKPARFWATVVAIAEFFGGVALILGIYVQTVAFIFVIEFFVINVWRIRRKQPLAGGFEFDLLILAASAALVTLGGGILSVDKFLFLLGY